MLIDFHQQCILLYWQSPIFHTIDLPLSVRDVPLVIKGRLTEDIPLFDFEIILHLLYNFNLKRRFVGIFHSFYIVIFNKLYNFAPN